MEAVGQHGNETLGAQLTRLVDQDWKSSEQQVRAGPGAVRFT